MAGHFYTGALMSVDLSWHDGFYLRSVCRLPTSKQRQLQRRLRLPGEYDESQIMLPEYLSIL